MRPGTERPSTSAIRSATIGHCLVPELPDGDHVGTQPVDHQ